MNRLPANIEVEDLISAGMIGLMDALKKFDIYRNDLFEEYETKSIDNDVYIFSHGGSRHVYKPFLDTVPRKVIVEEGLKTVKVWKEDFSKLFGEKTADGLLKNLLLDSDFRHALSLALTKKQWKGYWRVSGVV